MARRPCTFKQTDVTRALRATVKAGLGVQRCEIDKDGKIVVFIGALQEPSGKPATALERNEWDEALDGKDRAQIRQ